MPMFLIGLEGMLPGSTETVEKTLLLTLRPYFGEVIETLY